MQSNSKIDLARDMLNAGVTDDVKQIQSFIMHWHKEVLDPKKNPDLLDSESGREKYELVSKTTKYIVPTADGNNHNRWASDMSRVMHEERRKMYPHLFESKEAYEENTGRTLKPISPEEKEAITKSRRGTKPSKK